MFRVTGSSHMSSSQFHDEEMQKNESRVNIVRKTVLIANAVTGVTNCYRYIYF